MMTLRKKIHLARTTRGRVLVVDRPPPSETVPPGRVPRVARLMALAIRFDRLLRDGVVDNLSELARLVHVTQPRVTQILNLTLLAPDIQEEILTLEGTLSGRDPVRERNLRSIASAVDWSVQRARWWSCREGRGYPHPTNLRTANTTVVYDGAPCLDAGQTEGPATTKPGAPGQAKPSGCR